MLIPVLDASQAAQWDERARADAGIPSRVLMEAAGRAVAGLVARDYPTPLRDGILIAAGHGNNGGDGWVVARALVASGATVWVAESEHDRTPDCAANRTLALQDGIPCLGLDAEWPPVGIVVDALLGTGATGAPRGELAALATRVAGHRGPIVAIDGPTGLDLSTGEAHGPVRADLSVTFGGIRRGHLLQRDWCGKVVVVDIGFPLPDPAWPTLFGDAEARAQLPPFRADMHKGDRGHVVVIGGAQGMAGAALHAASAAFAVGTGLVKIAAAPTTVQAAQGMLPDALTVTTALGDALEPDLREAIRGGSRARAGSGACSVRSSGAGRGALASRDRRRRVADGEGRIRCGDRVPGVHATSR
jgi:NAD(P)H-hydrate epimerase